MQFRDPRTRWQFLPGRRLLFEELERRDLLAVMRIVDWNTFNNPNDAAGDNTFKTIFSAIGNETTAGNTRRIDILALQETDPPGAGDSITRVKDDLNSLYPTANYSFVVSPVDGGGDSTGFVYDASTVSLLESVQVGAGTLIHNVMRAKFQPVGSPAAAIFYVYSVHLKSGDTNSDETLRGSEAAFLHADANSLGEGTQVLMVGDFNMHTSAEPAWTNLLVSGAGSVQDVANAPGNWQDNAAFKSLHSQDPGGAMDDRFDIQFASGEFFDGTGVDYVNGSFHIFGNNGTHTLNDKIDTGTGASPTVLAALIAASDHLPAVADYQILSVAPAVRINESGGTQVAEGGISDTYQIVLNTVPSANVVVTVTPDSQVDIGNGAGVARQFTFTPGDALTPQTVSVSAVDDFLDEGDHLGVIMHSSASADPLYNGISIANVNAPIIDNDTSIVISELMYNPASDESVPGVGEWIEVVNAGNAATDISGWLFDDEDATDWSAVPSGTILGANQVAVFFDSAFTDAATFRAEWSVPASALVVGISWGSLGNTPAPGNEVLQFLDNHNIQRDVVNYDDTSPWPTQLEGRSIYLKTLTGDNNAGANWARSVVGTAKAVSATGPTFNTSDVGSPGRFFLPADYNANATVDAGDYVVWRKTLGSSTNLQADGSGPTVGTPNGVVDQADYTYWRSNFGGIGAVSGAGSGSENSQMFAATSSEFNEPAAAAKETIAEPVVFDPGLLSSAPDSSRSSRLVDYRAPAGGSASSADLLLAMVQSRGPTSSVDDFFSSRGEMSDDACDAIDHFFASLEEGEHFASAGLSSALL
jgi:endonuclease/exonuclease/phosphatase family metal-dependent hydrolase